MGLGYNTGRMVHYFKFRRELLDPAPGRDVYGKVGPGKGRPEECPPIRAASAFGFDLLANFDVEFVRRRDGTWRVEPDVVLESDFDWSPDDAPEDAARPLTQQYAWFWERGQKVPHPITDNVFETIKNQVKVSTFLYLRTDPNELLYLTDLPLAPLGRGYRVMTALVDTDWYPASYPWHTVLELDPSARRVTLRRGEPICRVMPLRRDTYFAAQMSPADFDAFFARGQRWLAQHGRPAHGETAAAPGDDAPLDLTHTYVRQQVKSRFVVMTH